MKIFVFLALVASAAARPDVGLGYHYQPPATSYGVPFGSVGGINDRAYYHRDALPVRDTFAPIVTPSRSFETPIREPVAFSGQASQQGGPSFVSSSIESRGGPSAFTGSFNNNGGVSGSPAFSTVNPGSSLNINTATFSSSTSAPVALTHGSSQVSGGAVQTGISGSSDIAGVSGVQSGSQFSASRGSFGSFGSSSSSSSGASFNQVNSNVQGDFGGEAQVQRHLYFFAAPEEPEEPRSRYNYPIQPPKKNVKILFIKTPTFRYPAPVQIPVQQNEEKTLVYVLVKKPEEQEYHIPEPVPTQPTKPEVYFIKYKTQQEAQNAINEVQGGQINAGGSVSANTVEGDQAFINSITEDDVRSSHGDSGFSGSGDSFESRGSFPQSTQSTSVSEVSGTASTVQTSPKITEAPETVSSTTSAGSSSGEQTETRGSFGISGGSGSSGSAGSSGSFNTDFDSGVSGGIGFTSGSLGSSTSSPVSVSGISYEQSGSDSGISGTAQFGFGGFSTHSSLDTLNSFKSGGQISGGFSGGHVTGGSGDSGTPIQELYGPPH